jgi:hypothetical protein
MLRLTGSNDLAVLMRRAASSQSIDLSQTMHEEYHFMAPIGRLIRLSFFIRMVKNMFKFPVEKPTLMHCSIERVVSFALQQLL